MKSNSRVVFFQVKSAKEKLSKICDMASFHFGRKEHFLIYSPDDKAEEFVNELLWRQPAESFLPHSISQENSDDWIVITKKKEDFKRARFIFNLRPTPLLLDTFQIVYELEDLTSLNKKMLSRKRFEAYKSLGWIIEAR